MDGIQNILCEILEESMDTQDNLPWYEREWKQDKLNAYCACCEALPFYIKNDREILARMLRCFCDAESGGVQNRLVDACECFCRTPQEIIDERYDNNPSDNSIFLTEVAKAAPEMLHKSPEWFGGFMFTYFLRPHDKEWESFIPVFKEFTSPQQQEVVNYIIYRCEGEPYNTDYKDALEICLKISGLKEGDSYYYHKYDNFTKLGKLNEEQLKKIEARRVSEQNRFRIRDFPKTIEDALEFLKAQKPEPLPLTVADDYGTTRNAHCDNVLVEKYDEVRKYLMKNPTIEAIPLFLNSFGNGDCYGNYQLIEDYLLLFPQRDVIPYIEKALTIRYANTRKWAAKLARPYIFDKSIRERLAQLLLSDINEEVRYQAISSLSFPFHITNELRSVLTILYHKETSESVKEIYGEFLQSE